MDILEINYSSYKGKNVGDWQIVDTILAGPNYVLLLEKDTKHKTFFIRRDVIKANSLLLQNDVYDLWYDDYKESKLLSLSEIQNADFVVNQMEILIDKYSKYDN